MVLSLNEVLIRLSSNSSRRSDCLGKQLSTVLFFIANKCAESRSFLMAGHPPTQGVVTRTSSLIQRTSSSFNSKYCFIRTYLDSDNALMDFYAEGQAPPSRYAKAGVGAPRPWRYAKRIKEQAKLLDGSPRSLSLEPEVEIRAWLDHRQAKIKAATRRHTLPLQHQIGHRN